MRILDEIREIGCILVAMRSAVLIIGLVLVATLEALGQPDIVCPTVQVTGPAGIPRPGEPVKFTVEVKGAGPGAIEYKWAVSKGKIVDGQGTPTISVDYELNGSSLTATAEVLGLPETCASTVSETISYCILPVPTLVAEGSVPINAIDKARLDKLAAELADKPDSQGYLIEYFPPKTTQRAVDAKIQMVLRHLKKSVDEARITIVIETAEKPFTRYYVVPPGAENPAP
jgi:hypothetical protein